VFLGIRGWWSDFIGYIGIVLIFSVIKEWPKKGVEKEKK